MMKNDLATQIAQRIAEELFTDPEDSRVFEGATPLGPKIDKIRPFIVEALSAYPMTWKLTRGEQQVLNALSLRTKLGNRPPTLRELANHLGMAAPSAFDFLTKLTKKGAVIRTKNGSRSYIVHPRYKPNDKGST